MTLLSGEQIARNGFVKGIVNAEKQVQPHGIDLRIKEIYSPVSTPIREPIKDEDYVALTHYNGEYILRKGYYLVRIAETINLKPIETYKVGKRTEAVKDAIYPIGFVRGRSSLLRRGVTIDSSSWECGYEGSGVLGMIVHVKEFRIQKGDRFAQMLVQTGNEPVDEYDGQYQGEGK
jgi:deoxycytidine triphosphate deaminase